MSGESKRAMLKIGDEERKLEYSVGVLADLEDAGYDPQKMMEDITTGGKTGPLLYLLWLLLAEGRKDGQREISFDEVRHLPPYRRSEMIIACVEATKAGFVMETSDDDEVRDPVLEEIEKKRTQES